MKLKHLNNEKSDMKLIFSFKYRKLERKLKTQEFKLFHLTLSTKVGYPPNLPNSLRRTQLLKAKAKVKFQQGQ